MEVCCYSKHNLNILKQQYQKMQGRPHEDTCMAVENIVIKQGKAHFELRSEILQDVAETSRNC